jgi:hypothetical protein
MNSTTPRDYHYDGDNYYTTDTPADPHPLTEGLWMNPPANAVRTPVAKPFPANKWPKLVGEQWVFVDSYRGTTYWLLDEDGLGYTRTTISKHEIIPPEGAVFSQPGPTLKKLKADKVANLTYEYRIRTYADIQYTSQSGHNRIYQAGSSSRDALLTAVATYRDSGTVPEGYYWRSLDNQNTPFTYSDLVALSEAIENRNVALLTKLHGYKDEVSLITLDSEAPLLADIVWEDA